MVIRNRFESVQHGDSVRLLAEFRGSDGALTDLDSFPQISIIQPSGNVMLAPTSSGVAHISTGIYEYDLTIGINEAIGVYRDYWQGLLSGFPVQNTLLFVVIDTNLPAVNSDGYIHLGDDVSFNYSQNEIANINRLLKALRARLNSSGKTLATDSFGNQIFVDCDIFSVDMLVTFLADSLWHFNEVPHFTDFNFSNNDFISQFGHILVQGATIYALASKALIERGREFQVSDNGLTFTPPTISDLMMTQYSKEMDNHTEMLKMIKGSLKPLPLGLGSMSVSVGRNTLLSQLRHRRARQIF